MVSNVHPHLLQRDWGENGPNAAEETTRLSAPNGDGQISYAANDTPSSNDCHHPFRPLKRKLQRTKTLPGKFWKQKDENADSKGIGASGNVSEFDAISKQEAKHTSLESVDLAEHTQMESTFENCFKHAPSNISTENEPYNYFQHYLSKRISDDIRKWDRSSGFSPAIQIKCTSKMQLGTRKVLEDTFPSPSRSVMEAFANETFMEFRLCHFLRHSTTLPFLTRNICSSKVTGKNKGTQVSSKPKPLINPPAVGSGCEDKELPAPEETKTVSPPPSGQYHQDKELPALDRGGGCRASSTAGAERTVRLPSTYHRMSESFLLCGRSSVSIVAFFLQVEVKEVEVE
jgi:hypothetical protein